MDTTWYDDVQLQTLSLAELAADCAAHPDEYGVYIPELPGESISYVETGHISGQSYAYTGIRAAGFIRRLRAAVDFLS